MTRKFLTVFLSVLITSAPLISAGKEILNPPTEKELGIPIFPGAEYRFGEMDVVDSYDHFEDRYEYEYRANMKEAISFYEKRFKKKAVNTGTEGMPVYTFESDKWHITFTPYIGEGASSDSMRIYFTKIRQKAAGEKPKLKSEEKMQKCNEYMVKYVKAIGKNMKEAEEIMKKYQSECK
ncbi:MAG: hypothetical protein HY026_02605 [Deltaproteobacteria bacterium]|nr:hypothetical protein [Deltaproteobacteria bacterium]